VESSRTPSQGWDPLGVLEDSVSGFVKSSETPPLELGSSGTSRTLPLVLWSPQGLSGAEGGVLKDSAEQKVESFGTPPLVSHFSTILQRPSH